MGHNAALKIQEYLRHQQTIAIDREEGIILKKGDETSKKKKKDEGIMCTRRLQRLLSCPATPALFFFPLPLDFSLSVRRRGESKGKALT